MGYYNISLTDTTNKIHTITTPFRKYKYNSIPMRVCTATDKFQEQMSALMYDLEFVRVYFGNFLIISYGPFKDHLANSDGILKDFPVGWNQMKY